MDNNDRARNRAKKKRLVGTDTDSSYGTQTAAGCSATGASTDASEEGNDIDQRNVAANGHCNNEEEEQDYLHHSDEWKRAWWNRSLGINEPANQQQQQHLRNTFAATNNTIMISNNQHQHHGNHKNKHNFRYAHKIQAMYSHTNPLPHQTYQQIWLEIGFGNGDNLLANAKQQQHNQQQIMKKDGKQNSNVLFMGAEVHQPGVGTLLRRMELELGLLSTDDDNDDVNCDEHGDDDHDKCDNGGTTVDQQNRTPSSSISASSCDNIRIIPGDGILLLSHLPNSYLDVILITFPDPWPKQIHAHLRVIQREVVYEMHRVLKKKSDKDGCYGGRVYVATDANFFDEWTRRIFQVDEFSEFWEEVAPCPDRENWLPAVSYYEQKGLDEGRSTMLQCWQCL